MKRIHYLAAEIFDYSYDNYEGHLGVNDRFDKFMPDAARALDAAIDGTVDMKKLGEKLEVGEDDVLDLLQRTKRAREIVDAENPAEGYREGVRQSIEHALKEGLESPAAVDALVVQICYRAADLSFALAQNEEQLEKYSEALRRESDPPPAT